MSASKQPSWSHKLYWACLLHLLCFFPLPPASLWFNLGGLFKFAAQRRYLWKSAFWGCPSWRGVSWAALFLSLPREQKLELSEWLSPNHGSEKSLHQTWNPAFISQSWKPWTWLRLEGKLTTCWDGGTHWPSVVLQLAGGAVLRPPGAGPRGAVCGGCGCFPREECLLSELARAGTTQAGGSVSVRRFSEGLGASESATALVCKQCCELCTSATFPFFLESLRLHYYYYYYFFAV